MTLSAPTALSSRVTRRMKDTGFSGPQRAREVLTFVRDWYTAEPHPERAASDMISGMPSRTWRSRWLETPPVAAATASSTVPSPESATTWRLLACLVDGQGPAAHLPAIHRRDGRLRIRLAGHLDKPEAPGAPRLAVHDDLHLSYLSSPLLEEGADLRLIHVKRQVPHIQSRSHRATPFVPAPAGPCPATNGRLPYQTLVVRSHHEPAAPSVCACLLDLLPPLNGSDPLLAEPAQRFAGLASAAIAGLFVVGTALEIA